ncbi:hypothetical protein BD779DRAFT_1664324 [Infundibulicybe gibba]|nr:hypothetical protein BD779DRAFT_1664324 [Infundibulicybe gibba]
MLDDDSDLTEIEDDEEYKERKPSSSKKAPIVSSYRIRKVLKVPRATTYTAQALYGAFSPSRWPWLTSAEQIHNSDINLEPEYQRDVVWPESKQIGIIDSIFRNFYIPPVIFVVNSFEDGSETKTCIDGKQRLTSIHRFMDGLIPHKDSLTGEKLWYTDVSPEGKTSRVRKVLPEKYRRLFANKQVVCVEYQDITDSDEREIFQLQVVSSSRATFIRQLQASFLTEDNGEALDWERARGADFRCLAQATYCIGKYDSGLQTMGAAPQLEKWLSLPEALDPVLTEKVEDTYRVFAELVLDDMLNSVFNKPAKVAPVEFVAISILIAVLKDQMSKAQLAATIGGMRDAVREAHPDQTLLDYIHSVKASMGAVAGAKKEKRKRSDADDGEAVKRKPKKLSPPRPSAASSAAPLPTPTPRPKPPLSARPTAPAPAPAPHPQPRPGHPHCRAAATQSPTNPRQHPHATAWPPSALRKTASPRSPPPCSPPPPHLRISFTPRRRARLVSAHTPASLMALASRADPPAPPPSSGGRSAPSRFGPEVEHAPRGREWDRERDKDRDRGRDWDRDRDRDRERERESERERERKAEREREKRAERGREREKETEYWASTSKWKGRGGYGGG